MKHKLGSIEREIWKAFGSRRKLHTEEVYDFAIDQGLYEKQIDNALQRLQGKGLIYFEFPHWRKQ